MALLIPLDNEFWQALTELDYEMAEELLKSGIEGTWYQHSGEVTREGDLLEENMHKYIVTYRATYVEDSAKVEGIEFASDGISATVYAHYQSELWLGCQDMGGISDEQEQLRVTLDNKECKAFLHVLQYPYERGDE